ncbi:hypothetical protein HMPREF3156_02590 [Neisseria sp. HMSC06F02]|nr:hypothetical protein HMPREF3156_02590 [Neisseria sp. HMSC06F02]
MAIFKYFLKSGGLDSRLRGNDGVGHWIWCDIKGWVKTEIENLEIRSIFKHS